MPTRGPHSVRSTMAMALAWRSVSVTPSRGAKNSLTELPRPLLSRHVARTALALRSSRMRRETWCTTRPPVIMPDAEMIICMAAQATIRLTARKATIPRTMQGISMILILPLITLQR